MAHLCGYIFRHVHIIAAYTPLAHLYIYALLSPHLNHQPVSELRDAAREGSHEEASHGRALLPRRAPGRRHGGHLRRGPAQPELLRLDVPQRRGPRAGRRHPEAPGDLQRGARHAPPLLPRLLRQGLRRVGAARGAGRRAQRGRGHDAVAGRARPDHPRQGGRRWRPPVRQPGVLRRHTRPGRPRRRVPDRRAVLPGGARPARRQGRDARRSEAQPPRRRLRPRPAELPVHRERPDPDRHDRALRGHTIGVTHCDKFVRRLYRFKGPGPAYSPPMNLWFLRQMRRTCPVNYSASTVAMLDAVTPFKFDNGYYQTLQQMKGLLASDQILFADRRSRATVNWFASNQTAFFDSFVAAMAKLGRVGVKTAGSDGEIRRVCTKVN